MLFKHGRAVTIFPGFILVCYACFSVPVTAQTVRLQTDIFPTGFSGDWRFSLVQLEEDVLASLDGNFGGVHSFAEGPFQTNFFGAGNSVDPNATGIQYRQCIRRDPDMGSLQSCFIPSSGSIERRRLLGYVFWTCLPGFELDQADNPKTARCTALLHDQFKSLGKPCCEAVAGEGNPVHPATGNKFQVETDYISPVPGGLVLRRYYNSRTPLPNIRFGRGWLADYWQRVRDIPGDPGRVEVLRPDGKIYVFALAGGAWQADPDVTLQLTERKDSSGNRTGWELVLPEDTVEVYDNEGTSPAKIISSTDRNGLTTTFAYDRPGGAMNPKRVDAVIDPFGRELVFLYDANEQVRGFIDPAGREYRYLRDGLDNLVAVIYPDGTPHEDTDNPQRLYHYENIEFPHSLTGITDENNNRFATYAYDDRNRVVISEHAGGAGRMEFTYLTDGSTRIIGPSGGARTLHFEISHGLHRLVEVTGDPCQDCGNAFAAATYDENGFLASRTDFNGNVTLFEHDARGLEVSRTEAAGTLAERTISTGWHPDFRLPVNITEPGREILFIYDSQGRLLERRESVR